jgi:hypothetical protein
MPEGGKITMHTGRPFDAGRKSDIDFFIVNKPLYDYVERLGRARHIDTHTLDPEKLRSLRLKGLADRLGSFRKDSTRLDTTLKIFADKNEIAKMGSYLIRKR